MKAASGAGQPRVALGKEGSPARRMDGTSLRPPFRGRQQRMGRGDELEQASVPRSIGPGRKGDAAQSGRKPYAQAP